MTTIGIIGAHNRECLQAFINPLIERGGVREIRILNLGNEHLIDDIIKELRLILEFSNIVKVEADSLIKNNGFFTEVIQHLFCFDR